MTHWRNVLLSFEKISTHCGILASNGNPHGVVVAIYWDISCQPLPCYEWEKTRQCLTIAMHIYISKLGQSPCLYVQPTPNCLRSTEPPIPDSSSWRTWPMSAGKCQRPPVLWWSDKCQRAVRPRKNVLKPISLTSCMCKVLQKLVSFWLTWYFYVFRTLKSTTVVLERLETVKISLAEWYMIAVFLGKSSWHHTEEWLRRERKFRMMVESNLANHESQLVSP